MEKVSSHAFRLKPLKWHHYLNDLRECVIYQSKVLEKKILEIAQHLDMSHHVVQRTLKLWKDIGDIAWNQGDLGTPG